MTPEQFCYWLQGYVETSNRPNPTDTEWTIIKDHLQLVFNKVTPYRDLNKIYNDNIIKDKDNIDFNKYINNKPIVTC